MTLVRLEISLDFLNERGSEDLPRYLGIAMD